VERSEYDRLDAAEAQMWWFRALHANLVAALAEGGGGNGRILDAGSGTGGLLARLAAAFPAAILVGLDRDEGAVARARAKSPALLVRGSVDRLPFGDAAFSAIVSADVLCHAGVDEAGALTEFRRCLKPGGALLLNLPAYRWLYSGHDVAVANARRYALGEVRELLAAAGFARIGARYWNSLLFPLMLARRLLWRRGGSDVAPLPAPLETGFAAALALERRLAAAGIALPFGGSILARAVKP
jgi:ubiquinone/menaquinone biosynthesis C-methylase UbiE